MLLAHLDTVHEKPVKHICMSFDKNILMSPQGIGGDDRCGVYAIVKAHEASPVKPWLLFTCDEEIGGVGADIFADNHSKGNLPTSLDTLKLLIEIDRKGSKDAVYYNCDNSEFEAYIISKGFVTAYGSFSDISIIAPELGVAAVNLSSGYYNAHTLHEYINRKQLEAVIRSIIGIIADAAKPDFPRYEYIERIQRTKCLARTCDAWDLRTTLDNSDRFLASKSRAVDETMLSDLPDDMLQMYSDLLEFYDQSELEWYREEYGDQIIYQLYAEEFGPSFDMPENYYEQTAIEW